jgi:hypothetical protein
VKKNKIQTVTLQDVKDFMKGLDDRDLDMLVSAGMSEQMHRLIASTPPIDELLKDWADDDSFGCRCQPQK